MPKTCPVCEQNGVESVMKIRQYSFNQAIWMCTNDKCTFPLGYKELDQFLVTYAKDIGELKYDPKLDGEDKCPSPNVSQDLPIPTSYSHSQHYSTHQTQGDNSIPKQSNENLAMNTASRDNTAVGSTPGYQEEMRNEDSDITELLELLNMPT